MTLSPTPPRTLATITHEILADWGPTGKGVYFGAKPYLQAMSVLDNVDEMYGADSARSVVRYFLANATSWRGETARRIKAELKSLVGDSR